MGKMTRKQLAAWKKKELKLCTKLQNLDAELEAKYQREKKEYDGLGVLQKLTEPFRTAGYEALPMLWRRGEGDPLPDNDALEEGDLPEDVEMDEETDNDDPATEQAAEVDAFMEEYEQNDAAGIMSDLLPERHESKEKEEPITLTLKNCAEWVYEVEGRGVNSHDFLGDHWTRMINELNDMGPISLPNSMMHGALDPWPYQLTGANKIVHLMKSSFRGGILGDAMGLGKTLTAIIAMEALFQENPRTIVFIIAPKGCLTQWEDSIRDAVYPHPIVKILEDTKTTPTDLIGEGVKYVLCSYQYAMSRHRALREVQEILARTKPRTIGKAKKLPFWKRRITEQRPIAPLHSEYWDMQGWTVRLILDEGHNIKNMDSKTFTAIKAIPAASRLYMSGTVYANRWQDCAAPISLLCGHPFKDRKRFNKAFANTHNTRMNAPPPDWKLRALAKFSQAFTVSRPVTMLEMPKMEVHLVDFEICEPKVIEAIVWHVRQFCKSMAMGSSGSGGAPEPGQAITGTTYVERESALSYIIIAELLATNPVLLFESEFNRVMDKIDEATRLCDKFMLRLETETDPQLRKDIFKVLKAYVDDDEAQIQLARTLSDKIDQIDTNRTEANQVDDDDDQAPIPPHRYNRSATSKREPSNEPADQPPAKQQKTYHEVFEKARSFIRPDPPGKKLKKKGVSDAAERNQAYTTTKESLAERREWLASVQRMSNSVLFTPRIDMVVQTIKTIYKDYDARRVLVFSYFKTQLDLVQEAIGRDYLGDEKPEVFRFDGSIAKPEVRTKILKDFREESKRMKILLITQSAGGTGLNIMAANHVIICEPWWRKADVLQADARAWRQGQKAGTVHSWRLFCTDSLVDHLVQDAADEKAITNETLEAYVRRKDGEKAPIPSLLKFSNA